MRDMIWRDDALGAIDNALDYEGLRCGIITKHSAKSAINSVEPAGPVIGHWIPSRKEGFVVCDKCKETTGKEGLRNFRRDYAATLKFCPECGAKMEGGTA